MNYRAHPRLLCLAIVAFGLFLVYYGRAHAGPVKKGAKSSDPRLTGPRDMNYDHTIVPGVRIGPVRMGGLVSDAVQHLGNPDKVWRTKPGPGLPSSDEVRYWYKDECISFSWQDHGIDPTIDEVGWGRFAMVVWCNKWSTPDGIQVGSSMRDLSSHLGEYCASNADLGNGDTLMIVTKQGAWYYSKGRNSPIDSISVVPATNTWNGMCNDK